MNKLPQFISSLQAVLADRRDTYGAIAQGIIVAVLFDFVIFLGTRLDALPDDVVFNAKLVLVLAGLTATWLLLTALPFSDWLAKLSLRFNSDRIRKGYIGFIQPQTQLG